MPPVLLFDLNQIDMTRLRFDVAAIEAINPHRGHMRMLDGLYYLADDCMAAVAFKDVRPDEFWVAGHIPGRPLFPGVLMVEAAAQLASLMSALKRGDGSFLGFIGIDDVKFRDQVVPGDRLLILSKGIEFRDRRSVCTAQGLVNGNLVFQATITGMPI